MNNIELRVKQDFINLKPQVHPPSGSEEGIVFLNDLDNKPKFKQSSSGNIYNLATSDYRAKVCKYEFSGDTNGLCHYIGSKFGKEPWAVPDIVDIFVHFSPLVDATEANDPNSIVSRNNSYLATTDKPFSTIGLTLGTPENLTLSGIYLKTPSVDTYGFIQSYKIVAAPLGAKKVVELYSVVNDDRLVGVNKELYIPLPDINFATSFVFIYQTDLNSAGNNHLCLGEIELYGSFY